MVEKLEYLPEDMTDEEMLLTSRAYYQMAYVFRMKMENNAEIDALRWALRYQRVVNGENVLNIRMGLKDARVEVYDMNGRLVHSQVLTENVTAIDAADWAEGVYVWKVYASQAGPSTGSGTSTSTLAETGKWVKE